MRPSRTASPLCFFSPQWPESWRCFLCEYSGAFSGTFSKIRLDIYIYILTNSYAFKLRISCMYIIIIIIIDGPRSGSQSEHTFHFSRWRIQLYSKTSYQRTLNVEIMFARLTRNSLWARQWHPPLRHRSVSTSPSACTLLLLWEHAQDSSPLAPT